jgi:ABC-type multidrug transport system fused ATPase/permease subunit
MGSTLNHFLHDVVSKLKKRFFALSLLSAACAVTDGLRIMVAFLLLPFIGISLDGTGAGFLGNAQKYFLMAGIPYTLGWVATAVIITFTVQAGLTLLQTWYQGVYTYYYTLVWRQQLFEALGRANWRFFLNTNRGELVNALTQETGRLSTATSRLLLVVSNLLVALAYVAASLLISIESTLMMAAVGTVVVAFNSLILKRLMRHSRAIVKGNNQMMVVTQEFLNNIKAVKAAPHGFAVEKMVAPSLQTIFQSEKIGFMLPHASRIVAELFVMLALTAGIVLASQWHETSVRTDILLVLVLFMRAYGKITMTMTSAQQMYVQLPGYEYVANVYKQVMDAQEHQWQEGAECSPVALQHGIRFENVSVLHAKKTALQNIDAFLPPRSVLALVGPSGAGKTTFVDTLLRLVDVSEGRITVGGRDIREFNIQSWRACFGYVSQELTLMNGSLADNIRLFKPDATEQEIQRAAKMAHAHEFIVALPEGYATQVGEMGLKLSGGQRQRIAVARALINDPPVLIFDEATSALDSESEEKVMEVIYDMRDFKTVILIAHRLSSIRDADSILVLEHGQLIEQGNWQTLMQRQGRLSQLWQRMRLPSHAE